MTLTAKQAAQVAKTAPPKRQALRAAFLAQNAPVAPKKPPRADRRKSAPAAAAKRASRRQGIPNFLDPMCKCPAPAVVSDGNALPHTGLVSADFVVGTTNTTVLLATNTGSSGTVGVIFNVDSEGTYVGGINTLTIPTLAAADIAGGPSASRAMKFSISVTNCTNALKRGGRVTYLHTSQRLPPITDAKYMAIIEAIKSSPLRRRITGDVLATPAHLVGYPVDNVEYSTFRPHSGTLTNGEFYKYVLGATATTATQPRPMSIVAYVFDPVADNQDYSVTIRASQYTRWPLTSVPGQSMQAIPTAPAGVINHVRDAAEANANDMAHIIEGGAIATLAPKAAAAARGAAGRWVPRLGGVLNRGAVGAVEAAQGAAADVVGPEAAALLMEAAAVL